MFTVSQRNRPLVVTVCLLVIAVSLVCIIRRCHPSSAPSQIGLDVDAILGATLANETAKLLGGKGRILIVALDTTQGAIPPAQRQLAGFQNALTKHPGLTVVATGVVEPDPVKVLADGEFGIPAEKFRELLGKYAGADAIVSFVGAPKLTDREAGQLSHGLPRIVASYGLGYQGPELEMLLARGIVQVALVPNPSPPPITDTKMRPAREWFELGYQVLTAPAGERR